MTFRYHVLGVQRQFRKIAHLRQVFAIWHGVRYSRSIFKNNLKQSVYPPGGWYAQNSKWRPLEIGNIISRHLLALDSHVIPPFICFLVLRIHF